MEYTIVAQNNHYCFLHRLELDKAASAGRIKNVCGLAVGRERPKSVCERASKCKIHRADGT